MLLYNEEKLKHDPIANFGRPYQQCTISVMDTIADPNITFDEKGVCNYYYEYKEAESKFVFKGEKGNEELKKIIDTIKENGKGKKYDCITGVSGGVDSTYLTLQAKKWGLRPLVVHFDNGWNSELAVKNIENIISKLGFDLYTLVVNWEEFKDIQLAYIKANVIDIEAITDHAIITTIYQLASKNNIKYILSGSNIVTEKTLPSYWVWNKADDINIRDIHKKFGRIPLKTFPILTSKKRFFYVNLKKIESIALLNLINYNKSEVKKTIINELDWKDYGGKHYESIWTRFYQGYILPNKFGIDKRKAHLSDLIFSGQITKEIGLNELKKPIYDFDQLSIDKEFILKKLGLSEIEFDNYIYSIPKRHNEYKHIKPFFVDYPFLSFLKPVWTRIKN